MKEMYVEGVATRNDSESCGRCRRASWFTLDPKTGVLLGTATTVGVNVFIVAAKVLNDKATFAYIRTVMLTVTE